MSWGKNNSRPYTQQPAAASTIPYYPGGTYIPSVPMPAYPGYPPVDPYAGYHALGQPGTNPYLMQAKLPEIEMHSSAWSFTPEIYQCLLHARRAARKRVKCRLQCRQTSRRRRSRSTKGKVVLRAVLQEFRRSKANRSRQAPNSRGNMI